MNFFFVFGLLFTGGALYCTHRIIKSYFYVHENGTQLPDFQRRIYVSVALFLTLSGALTMNQVLSYGAIFVIVGGGLLSAFWLTVELDNKRYRLGHTPDGSHESAYFSPSDHDAFNKLSSSEDWFKN